MITPEQIAEEARRAAMQLRISEGIPVRVLVRDGTPIWSKVDADMRDLTPETSEGLLYHVRSVFVPHGAVNPLTGKVIVEHSAFPA